MTVVVGGQCRKAGKTLAMCRLIAATREMNWIAVKISPHPHDALPGGDTERYLAAGAVAAHLLRPGNSLPAAEHLVIESNGVLQCLQPDLLFFVVDPGSQDWKESARGLAERANAVVTGGNITPDHVALIRATARLRP